MNDTVNQQYDLWHEEMARAEAEDTSEAPWHQLAKPHIGDLRGLRVLEIGCGRGGFSRYLHDCGADLVAADFSASAISTATRLLAGRPRLDLRVADIQAIPFQDAEFDLVVSLETLEHVPDPDRGLRELVRVTRPGGRLVITTPNFFGLLGLYRRYRDMTGRPFTELGQPINHPLKVKDRVRRLKQLGCRIECVDGCGHYLYIPKRDPVRMKWPDDPRFLMKWFAAHSLTTAIRG